MHRAAVVVALVALACTGCSGPTARAEGIQGRWVSEAVEGEGCGDFISRIVWVFRADGSGEVTVSFREPEDELDPIKHGVWVLEGGRLFIYDDSGVEVEIPVTWMGDELLLTDTETGCTVVLHRDR